MPAGTLSCPMCGAPVASLESSLCDHCGARLATVACPSCFSIIFDGAKFCSHCGAKVEREEIGAGARSSCPHCKIMLDAVTVGDAKLNECSRCEGVWVDKETFTRICADREEQSAVLGMPTALPQHSINSIDLKVRYYPCPICKSFMNRVNFARCSGVIVDVCRAHGTWFDKDELRRIVEFIRAGGLDKAREMEIEELRRQRERLEAERSRAREEDLRYSARTNWSGTSGGLFAGITAVADVLGSWFD